MKKNANKKRILSMLLSFSMVASIIHLPAVLPMQSVAAAGGNCTIIASQDAYVQGSSQISIPKGAEDPNNLLGRDWSDVPEKQSAYQLPYLQFEIPSNDEIPSIEYIQEITLKVYCMSAKNDEYIVGLSNLASFDENTITYSSALSGEKNYPDGANRSKRLDFDHEPIRIEGSQLGMTSMTNEWIEFDITDTIKNMIKENSTGKSKSVVLTLAPRSRTDNPSLAYHGSAVFASKEYQDGVYAPRIEIKAESTAEKSGTLMDDRYKNGEETISNTEELYVSNTHSAYVEFNANAEQYTADEIINGKIVLSKKSDSSQSKAFMAEVLEDIDDTSGTAVTVVEENENLIILDVTEILKLYAGTEKKLILKLSSDNEKTEPVILYSLRSPETDKSAKLYYTLKYEGNVYRLEPIGVQDIEISLDSLIKEKYTYTAYDQYEELVSTSGLTTKFSLDEAPEGVSITSDGVLTVLPDAFPGVATVRVEISDMPEVYGTLSINITLPKPESIVVTGGLKAKVPSSDVVLRKTYVSRLYDSQGNQFPISTRINWKLLSAPEGVSVEPKENGEAELVINNKNGTIKIGDVISLEAYSAEYPEVKQTIAVELGEQDEVYNTIRLVVSEDTFIKQSDYAQTGNVNSQELLAKLNSTTSKIIPTLDYFGKEGTNRESYLKFNGITALPKDIISAQVVLTTKESYNETEKSPASGMPKAELYVMNTTEWSEEEGTITSRLPINKTSKIQSKYNVSKNAEIRFDVTEIVSEYIASGQDETAFRIGMVPINNNGYVHKYYSKEAKYLDEASGVYHEIQDSKKPHLEITASYVRVPSGIALVGEKNVGIMLEESSNTYKVCLLDQYNQLYSDDEMEEFDTSISLKEDYEGITLKGSVLTVSPEVEFENIQAEISVAQFPEMTKTETITLYKAEAAQIIMSGPESIQIPPKGETVSAKYTMDVYDQNDIKVELNDIIYELKENQIGVTLDNNTGMLHIEDYAVENRDIVIRAYSNKYKTVNSEMTVRLLPRKELIGQEKHPNLLYGKDDLPALRERLNAEPYASYYNTLKQSADTYTAQELQYFAATDPREEGDEYDHVYPLVEVDEEGNERVLDRKRPWQWMMTDLFYTQGNFTFTPPSGAKYARAQAIAKGQGITNFDKFTLKVETGTALELYNPSFEIGNRRYVNEDIPYIDGSEYQVMETSADGEWEYLNDVSKPMPDGMYYIRRKGSNTEFEWDDQKLHREIVTTEGERAAKIRNNTVASEAGISTDMISIKEGTSYVLSTGFGANDKLIGEQGRLPEYSPLDKTAGLYMKVVYYNEEGEEIGEETWMDNPYDNRPMNINWQVKPLRRSFDTIYDACNTVYAITRNIEYALRAEEYLKYQLKDMLWGMKYRTTTGYNPKMNDTYEAVHVGRHLQRNALGYDMIYDSGVINDEEDAQIRQMFNDIAYELTSTSYFNYASKSGQIHNYNADRISGLILYMLCFPENKGTEKNKFKDSFEFFYDHVMNEKNVWSFPMLLKNGIYDAGEEYGGMWCENMRYQSSVHKGWILSSKALDRYNPEFNYLQSDEMKKMARMWITTQGPKLTISTDAKNLAGYMTVGDQSWREELAIGAWCASFYKSTDPELSAELMYTWDRMGSELGASYSISAIMDCDPTLPRKNPKLGSAYLKNVGYTYFRQNFDVLGEENIILIPNSPGYGNKNQVIHDHSDRGSFGYIANGVPMSLDSGSGGYFSSDSAFWRSSRAHNEILFWSDAQGWLSNAGGDGNSYTSDTAKTRNYDSETVDVYLSQEIDRATVKVNPAQRSGKDTNLQWNRHFAYIKDGIDALVFWDEVLNTRKSQFNLYMASKSYVQDNNIITANMHGNMQMEVHMLNTENPEVSDTWVPSPGVYGLPTIDGEEQQQLIQYEQSNGEDFLTVLYPKKNGSKGLKQTAIESPEGVSAFKMTKEETGKSVYIAYNCSDNALEFVPDTSQALRNPQTDEIIDAGNAVSVPAGKMIVLLDSSIEKPIAERIEISGDNIVGIPLEGQTLSYTYDSRVFDNYGNTIDDAEVEYAIEGVVKGCTIDKDGTLLIDDSFDGGNIIVSAVYNNVKSTMTVTTSDVDTEVVSVDIEGSNILTVPSSGSSTYTYKSIFQNKSGGTVLGAKALWRILDSVEGVSINSYTGVLTIRQGIEPGTVMNINVSHFNDPSITKTIEIVFVAPKESGICVNAPSEIAVGSKEVEAQLNGYVIDQMGMKFSDSQIQYSLKTTYEGVNLDSDGVLKISPNKDLIGKTVVIVAKSETKQDNTTEIKIKIVENKPSSISITGKDKIITDSSGAKVQYTATVKDKNGDIIDAEVVWSLKGIDNASVTDGKVVINKKTSGILTLTATVADAPDISIQKKVTVSIESSLSGGGGGGGGGAISTLTAVNVAFDEKADNGVKTDSNSGEFRFGDVPDSHWAAEYIYSLYKKGAVNGRTSELFEPDEQISRAEFVKMLLLAIDFDGAEIVSEQEFVDSPADSWYYPYVKKAAAFGIVKGITENYFGANEWITREQLAAMIYRTAQVKGITLDADAESFDDLEDISEYAVVPVMALKKAGILNGMDANKFVPKVNATRAESTKVIECLRVLLETT